MDCAPLGSIRGKKSDEEIEQRTGFVAEQGIDGPNEVNICPVGGCPIVDGVDRRCCRGGCRRRFVRQFDTADVWLEVDCHDGRHPFIVFRYIYTRKRVQKI